MSKMSKLYEECHDCRECKNAALARLKDAIALLNAGRYMGTLYMTGYVIEIGVKSELFRLAEIEISFDMGKEILDYLSDVALTKPKNEIETEQRRQYLKKLLDNIFRSSKGPIVKTLKAFLSDTNLPKQFSEIPASWVIIYNEYPSNPKKKSNNPNTPPPKSKSHNIEDFLDELLGWKNLFKETPPDNNQYFDLNRYKFDFAWDTKLRYSFENDQISAQDVVKAKAKKAVETSIDFLKDVLGLKNEIKELMKKPISNKD